MAQNQIVYRHSITTRTTHWIFFIAFLVLFSSGLQIFNAAPYLDASDKSNPARRVLSIDSTDDHQGTTTIFGHTFHTTGLLGYTDDGMGGRTDRAFPGWLTIPAYQSLADGRRWHLFFAWIMIVCGIAYVAAGLIRGDVQQLILRKEDLPKILPMQLYYFRLRKEAPPHGKYNPLQKTAYTLVIFVMGPLLVLTGLALSPGFDAWFAPFTSLFGGRQFARLWHFAFMLFLTGFLFVHLTLVSTTGIFNHIRSMITGWYKLGAHDGVGV